MRSVLKIITKPLRALIKKGPRHCIRESARHALLDPIRLITLVLFKTVWTDRRFEFNNKIYPYNTNIYNWSWANDRSVEIPIFEKYLSEYKEYGVLEVGNVLSHYVDVNHTIIDKYEQAQNVLNCDILNYTTEQRFELIISISTIEHIGWFDYDPKERSEGKVLQVVNHLRTLLTPSGRLIFSFPKGYNSELDLLFRKGDLTRSGDKAYFLRRSIFANNWTQCSIQELGRANYIPFLRISRGLIILDLQGAKLAS